MTKPDLELLCPSCDQRFGVSMAGLNPQAPRVVCGHCAHMLSPDEILNAMAASLNDLLDQTRDRLTGVPGKPET